MVCILFAKNFIFGKRIKTNQTFSLTETFRLHPPFDILTRECTKDYKIAKTNAIIEKGTVIYISITGPQHDPKYYDRPTEFIPDRFKDKNSGQTSLDMPFYTFGDGPRNCIGMRLGKINSKLGVCLLLREFVFELGAQHMNNSLEFDPKGITRAPISGIRLKCKRRVNDF